jgi:hypothetical protein
MTYDFHLRQNITSNVKLFQGITWPWNMNMHHVIFLHAVLGRDTSSRLYGIGKGVFLKQFKSIHLFREQSNVFAAQSVCPEVVATEGETVMVSEGNEKPGKSPDHLLHKRWFCENVAVRTGLMNGMARTRSFDQSKESEGELVPVPNELGPSFR